MRALLDTNVLIRHLTGDPSAQALRATALLRGAHQLILTDLILAEMVYVLGSVYQQSPGSIAEMGRALLALPSIAVADDDLLFRALELYADIPLDFGEAYVAAVAERTGVRHVVSFDRSIDRLGTIKRSEP